MREPVVHERAGQQGPPATLVPILSRVQTVPLEEVEGAGVVELVGQGLGVFVEEPARDAEGDGEDGVGPWGATVAVGREPRFGFELFEFGEDVVRGFSWWGGLGESELREGGEGSCVMLEGLCWETACQTPSGNL